MVSRVRVGRSSSRSYTGSSGPQHFSQAPTASRPSSWLQLRQRRLMAGIDSLLRLVALHRSERAARPVGTLRGAQVAEASSGRIPRPLLMRSGTNPALFLLFAVYKVKHDPRTRRARSDRGRRSTAVAQRCDGRIGAAAGGPAARGADARRARGERARRGSRRRHARRGGARPAPAGRAARGDAGAPGGGDRGARAAGTGDREPNARERARGARAAHSRRHDRGELRGEAGSRARRRGPGSEEPEHGRPPHRRRCARDRRDARRPGAAAGARGRGHRRRRGRARALGRSLRSRGARLAPALDPARDPAWQRRLDGGARAPRGRQRRSHPGARRGRRRPLRARLRSSRARDGDRRLQPRPARRLQPAQPRPRRPRSRRPRGRPRRRVRAARRRRWSGRPVPPPSSRSVDSTSRSATNGRATRREWRR